MLHTIARSPAYSDLLCVCVGGGGGGGGAQQQLSTAGQPICHLLLSGIACTPTAVQA